MSVLFPTGGATITAPRNTKTHAFEIGATSFLLKESIMKTLWTTQYFKTFSMISSVLVLFSLVWALFAIAPGSSLAATYYVSPSGNDSNPGTQTAPWATITKAAATVVAGDTVNVLAGTYIDLNATYDRAFSPARSGTAGNPITFKSSPPLAAVITSPKACVSYTGDVSALNLVSAFAIDRRHYIVVDGFKVIGTLSSYGDSTANSNQGIVFQNNEVTCGSAQGGDKSLNWGIIFQATDNSTIQNNFVHDIVSSGNYTHNTATIMVGFGSDNNIIQNNAADCSGGMVHSAYGTKAAVTNNIWRYNIGSNCISGFHGTGMTDSSIVSTGNFFHNNIIYNMSAGGIGLDHATSGFMIYNNTFYNVQATMNAIYYSRTCGGNNSNWDHTFYNNIAVRVAAGTSQGYFWEDYPYAPCTTVDPFTVLLTPSTDYNDLYGFTYWAKIGASGGAALGSPYSLASFRTSTSLDTHSITADPLFVNAAAYDFHLQSNSPAKGTGRGGVDMGAYSIGTLQIGPTNSLLDRPSPPIVRVQ